MLTEARFKASLHVRSRAELQLFKSMAATSRASELGTTLERDTTPTTPKRPHLTTTHTSNTSMSSTPLQSLWDASASQPFTPAISKEQQFTVGFTLLFAALVLTGLFGMSM